MGRVSLPQLTSLAFFFGGEGGGIFIPYGDITISGQRVADTIAKQSKKKKINLIGKESSTLWAFRQKWNTIRL